MPFLSATRIGELTDTLIDAGLATNDNLDTLAANLPRAYTSRWPRRSSPVGTMSAVLDDLNNTDRLTDGTVPFVVWLQGAARLTRMIDAPTKVINAVLAEINAKSTGGASLTPADRAVLPTGRNEQIIGRDELLPFEFLKGGFDAGKSVARLSVQSYQNGVAQVSGGEPIKYVGTGWLLAPDLLMTNHHVINAREPSEGLASADDLQLQAKSMLIDFDFEAAAVNAAADIAPPVTVKAIEAFGSMEGPLDYALLRLSQSVALKPLTISPDEIMLPPNPDLYPAVNIIQHPNGGPKMVACRSNLVVRVANGQLYYLTDTMNGSSGSPVFDDKWRVVGLHKKTDYLQGISYRGKDNGWVNVGTAITRIVDDLRRQGKFPGG